MIPVKAGPRRPLRNELYALAMVMVAPLAIVAVFPFEALRLAPGSCADACVSSCAFVLLTADEEASATTASRTAWKVNMTDTRSLTADLLTPSISDEELRPASCILDSPLRRESLHLRIEACPLPPTLAAGKPAKIEPESPKDGASVAFPRKELLSAD